ncbi:hypothetical protein [Nakamurella endophytica]|uniref:Uncharacterized protein n=1 Tax=Nakamurella endophytica TaxID=1748367 RepID=A0A917T842_9ACTN|nr:hypothetical protein [Nakamurella endophytica]GGM12500.1 hypothetical protein GCM10011594_35490 [Nakamurella endophytica]
MTAAVRTRPGLVVLVVVLVVLGAIGFFVTGIVAMSAHGGVSVVGVLMILLGLVYLAVAKGLADGNRLACAVVTVVAVLQILATVLGWILRDQQYQDSRGPGTGSAVVAVVILICLYTPKASAYFQRSA